MIWQTDQKRLCLFKLCLMYKFRENSVIKSKSKLWRCREDWKNPQLIILLMCLLTWYLCEALQITKHWKILLCFQHEYQRETIYFRRLTDCKSSIEKWCWKIACVVWFGGLARTSLTVLKNSLPLHSLKGWCRWVLFDIIVSWMDGWRVPMFIHITTLSVGVLWVDGVERQSVSHAYNYTFFTI